MRDERQLTPLSAGVGHLYFEILVDLARRQIFEPFDQTYAV